MEVCRRHVRATEALKDQLDHAVGGGPTSQSLEMKTLDPPAGGSTDNQFEGLCSAQVWVV